MNYSSLSSSSSRNTSTPYHVLLKVDLSHGLYGGLEPVNGWNDQAISYGVKAQCNHCKKCAVTVRSVQLKKDEIRGKPCLHRGRIWARRDRHRSHDWVPLELPSYKTGTDVMIAELTGEFRLESSLSLSGPVDLSETNNEWISLMNKPNSTPDKFIKKFHFRNGHYRASIPTWMDPDYEFGSSPIHRPPIPIQWSRLP